MNCPNCNNEFTDTRDKHYQCEDCGWFIEVDGKWRPCPEPPKPKEPELKPELEQIPEKKPDKKENNSVRSYLGGIITVTNIEDKENADND